MRSGRLSTQLTWLNKRETRDGTGDIPTGSSERIKSKIWRPFSWLASELTYSAKKKLFSNQHLGLLEKNASGLKSSRKILHDPTQLLNIFQSMLSHAESIAKLCLIFYNLLIQVTSIQWVWTRGIFQIVRDVRQCLVVNINGFPFQLQKMPLANEMRDSSGNINRLQFLQCYFTDRTVEIFVFTGRQERFPYLHKETHFRAAVTVFKEDMVIMEIGSVKDTLIMLWGEFSLIWTYRLI